jgi:DNA-binding NarL/FixJ family response regulator
MTKRIVIVDDDETCMFLYRHHFQGASGVEIIAEFENAEEALAEIPLLMPDMVIVDYKLPGMTGVELAHHLKKWPEIKVLLATGHESDFIKNNLTSSTSNLTIVPKNWSAGTFKVIMGFL